MEKYLNLSLPVGITIFVLSCVKNIILCCLVFAIQKNIKKIGVNNKAKIIVFACLSDVIAFLTAFIIFKTQFNTNFADFFLIEDILLFSIGTMISSSFLIKCIGVFIGMLCIFLFDYFVAFRKWVDVSNKHKLWLSVVFAVINAPYFFFFDVENIIYNYF